MSCAIVSLESVIKLRATTIHRLIKNSGDETHIDAIEQARHEIDIKSSAEATAEHIICMNANIDMPLGMLNISSVVDSKAETMGNISFFILFPAVLLIDVSIFICTYHARRNAKAGRYPAFNICLSVVDDVERIFARKIDAAFFIDLGYDDLDFVADVDNVLDLAYALGVKL